MSFASLLNQTCDIEEKSITKDEYGQPSETWSTVSGGSSVACRVQPVSASRKENDQMEYAVGSHKIYIAEGSFSIDEHNRINVSGGQNYIVKFAKKDSSLHHWELMTIAEDLIQ